MHTCILLILASTKVFDFSKNTSAPLRSWTNLETLRNLLYIYILLICFVFGSESYFISCEEQVRCDVLIWIN